MENSSKSGMTNGVAVPVPKNRPNLRCDNQESGYEMSDKFLPIEQNTNDNSSESDFEFVHYSDSENEGNTYLRLDDVNYTVSQESVNNLKVLNSNQIKSKNLKRKSNCAVKVNKLNLSSSEIQIHRVNDHETPSTSKDLMSFKNETSSNVSLELKTKSVTNNFHTFGIKVSDKPEKPPRPPMDRVHSKTMSKSNHQDTHCDHATLPVEHGRKPQSKNPGSENSTPTKCVPSTREYYPLRRNRSLTQLQTPTIANNTLSDTDINHTNQPKESNGLVKPLNLHNENGYRNGTDSKTSSSSNSTSGNGVDQLIMDDFKKHLPSALTCRLCDHSYKDPRTLNCLHSFCFQCLVNESYGKDANITLWSRPDEWERNSDGIAKSNSEASTSDSDCQQLRPDSSSSTGSPRSMRLFDMFSRDKNKKSRSRNTSISMQEQDKNKTLTCPICHYRTEMPIGGIMQLPQNFILVRKVQKYLAEIGSDTAPSAYCGLCCVEVVASFHCLTCSLNLCNFCKEAHERQRNTNTHILKAILELRRNTTKNQMFNEIKQMQKCSLHPEFDLKFFCVPCLQLVCSDCIFLLHKGHKHDSVHKAFKTYHQVVKDYAEKAKPQCEYVALSIGKLSGISKKVNGKCDKVQNDVEAHIASYFQAVEIHRRTLLQQLSRARETKQHIIVEQQYDLEQRCSQTKTAIDFSEELLNEGNEAEFLSFVNILLNRLTLCHKSKIPLDPKISDTVHFFTDMKASAVKGQNDIPLYGIISTQTVEPANCTLQTEVIGYPILRVNRKAELIIVTRDTDDIPITHGGLLLKAQVKYRDGEQKIVPSEVIDRKDGKYAITFVPDSAGAITLNITITDKPIKGSPFNLQVKTLHCCTFCTNKRPKNTPCTCKNLQPTYKGCGH